MEIKFSHQFIRGMSKMFAKRYGAVEKVIDKIFERDLRN
jgi:hypothetical protein